MAILSKVKSAVSKVGGAVKKVASAAKGIFNSAPASTQIASPIAALPSSFNKNQTLAPNITTPQGKGQVQGDGSIVLVNNQGRATGGVINSRGTGSTQIPSGSGGGLMTALPSPIYSVPVSIYGGQQGSSSGSTSFSSEPTLESMTNSFTPSSVSSSSLSSSTPTISLPSAPTYSDPGTINNAGLINSLSDSYKYDSSTNTFLTETTQANPSAAETEAEKRNSVMQKLIALIPQKESVLDTPEIRKQQKEVDRQKKQVATYTAQLNNVVAQQNADLLRVRGDLSREGSTETVYGGIAATINREAAIKALPIQASLSAAQGNLDLAQDYLTQLTTWKTEQVNNDYTYRANVYSTLAEYVKGEENSKLEQLKTENQRKYDMVLKNIEAQDSWAKKFADTNPAMISRVANLDPYADNFREQLYRVTGGVVGPADGKLTPAPEEALKINKELVTNDSLLALTEFENLFNETGATSAVLSPRENAELQAKYNTAILNLKEFFNLGVLNGPDETILKGILTDPTGRSAALSVLSLGAYKPAASTKAGIESMKRMIESTLDDRFKSLVSQYGAYSTDSVTSLGDLERIYVEQKAKLNPEITKMIQTEKLTPEDVVQVLYPELKPAVDSQPEMDLGNQTSLNRPTRNNNPLNIKASEVTRTYPGVAGVDKSPASDGGNFLIFKSPEDGFKAAERLITSRNYKNLSVDAALKRWSNSGYGGEIVPELKGKTIAQLTNKELDKLIRTMARREGYNA
jgi:hypothetical protein